MLAFSMVTWNGTLFTVNNDGDGDRILEPSNGHKRLWIFDNPWKSQ